MKRPCDTCGATACAAGRGYDWKRCKRYKAWLHEYWKTLPAAARRLDHINWMLRHLRLKERTEDGKN